MTASTARKLGLFSAISIVVANIIGTGIFTTTGFQAASMPSQFAIMMIWLVGGVLALCGALAYGELASAMPRSGGEYHYLSVLYHPSLGFTSGFISLVAGFAAPVAASAMAFGKYLAIVWPAVNQTWAAAGIVVAMSLLHSLNVHYGARVQNVFTVTKIALIVFFIFAGLFWLEAPQPMQLLPTSTDWHLVMSTAFAIGLVYVSYSYSGWNAAAYIAGEVDNAKRNVPLALLVGTLVVMGLYLLVNFVFLYSAPLSALAGKVEVGEVSASYIFGAQGGQILSTFIALALVSSVSSMMMAGPRVMHSIGEDIPALGLLAQHNKNGVPMNALLLQAAIALGFIFSGTFEFILGYIGFTLSIFAALTVAGVFIRRLRRPDLVPSYTTWGYPFTPALFIGLSLWMVLHNVWGNTQVALAGLGTIALGLGLYAVLSNRRAQS